jgi:hypothetical protein
VPEVGDQHAHQQHHGHTASEGSTRLNRRRLEAMGEVLDQWAEYEAQQLLPALTRVVVIERPSISKEPAQRLHEVLLDYLGDLEAAWERRN